MLAAKRSAGVAPEVTVADLGFGQGGAKNFFPRFCRHNEVKSGKQSEQYDILIQKHFDKFLLFLICRYINL